MHALALCLAALMSIAGQTNPCTNGSFEELDANGRPVDWEPMGAATVIETDAPSGNHALRITRSADAPYPEDGLNRAWLVDSGRQDALLSEVKGGIEFSYKAVSATNDNLVVCVIPMNERPFEASGSRALFRIPKEHVGDGKWHRARLKYDYSDVEDTRWVHFGARISGGPGELLLDDLAWIPEVGPILALDSVHLLESDEAPGDACTVTAMVINGGDKIANNVRVRVDAPGFDISPDETVIEALDPDARRRMHWQVTGTRATAGIWRVIAESEAVTAESKIPLRPDFRIKSWGPVTPVAKENEPVALECELENRGNTAVVAPSVTFTWPGGTAEAAGPDIPPDSTVVLSAVYTPASQSPSVPLSVTAGAADVSKTLKVVSELVVGSAEEPTIPDMPCSAVIGETAVVSHGDIRVLFRKNAFGYGPGEVRMRSGDAWKTVAWLPRLSTLVYRDPTGERREEGVFATEPRPGEVHKESVLRFDWSHTDPGGAVWNAEISVAVGPGYVGLNHRLECDQERDLLRFDGPMIYAMNREEAVFPGLEWIIGDEVSSDDRDIQTGHKHQVRYVPHAYMVTIPTMSVRGADATLALDWDIDAQWADAHRFPTAVFASPDRFNNQRGHLMGLQVPSVPWYLDPNDREAAVPYKMVPGRPVRLYGWLTLHPAGTDVLDPITETASKMVAKYTPAGNEGPLESSYAQAHLPRGTYFDEIGFSMQAYFDALWDADKRGWWASKNGPPQMSAVSWIPTYAADLALGANLASDTALRERCRTFVEELCAERYTEPRESLLRHGLRADLAYANPQTAATILAERGPDGLWRFDADRGDTGVFKGMDYHLLGPDNAVAVGMCAANAYQVLKYARIAGDWEAYESVLNALEYMETEAVPRAAQVWEVQFMAPDVLAAADAVDAYLEAYRLTGDERWLQNAVMWARRGIPFVYLWEDSERPYVLGASIPIFGASWQIHSWFGMPVQWNGLRLAESYLKLAEYDQSLPWRAFTELLMGSAINQQATEGEDTALWPDAIGTYDGVKSPWVFSPRQILLVMMSFMGRSEEPRTVMLGEGRERLHVTAVADIGNASWDGSNLAFDVTYPSGTEGVVLVANCTRPDSVLLNGSPVPERATVETGDDPGWRHDEAMGYLSIRVTRDGTNAITISDTEYRPVDRMPRPVSEISFEFESGIEGWVVANHITNMKVTDGALTGSVTGVDPYLVRSGLQMSGDDYDAVVIRMQVEGSSTAQFYWVTGDAPTMAEERGIVFETVPDGAWHEYRIPLGGHPLWRGKDITSIRIDPSNGAATGRFAIDYVRGVKE